MKISLESTGEIADVNGVAARAWTGTTERGTPVVVFVVRVAAGDGGGEIAHAELAAEFADLIADPPTRHGVFGEEPVIAAPRPCTVCAARSHGAKLPPAAFVATNANGGQWFECGAHHESDNLTGEARVHLEAITAWFERHVLPLPGGNATLREHLHAAVAAKVGELASEVRSLRVRLAAAKGAPEEPHWLVKDFYALYRVAAATLDIKSLADTRAKRDALKLQLERLKPAFLACDGERRGAVPS
jgi:hypothetical protein